MDWTKWHLIRRLAPRIALRQDELLVLYVMLSLVTTMMGVDILQPVISVLGHAFRFATVIVSLRLSVPFTIWEEFATKRRGSEVTVDGRTSA